MQRNSTIGELMERKRIQDGAKEYQGHTYMDLARFDEATKHMIIFDHRLLSGKKEAYAEYRQVKKDMQEYLIAKQTVEHILGIDRKNRIITQQQNLD